ncbi:hypothetical protein GY45DRAFT_1375745 [Cubamyces sp. BRFM 1775]|nr:hypothetical protein GY45DRAFT_1375745 [Cubamyces sp. BRFM 1775]
MSSSADVAALIQAYQGMFDYNAIGYACLALLVYDWLTSLGQESVVIWSKPKTAASAFLTNIVFLQSCVATIYFSVVLKYVAMIAPALFSALRVYALSQKNKPLSAVVLLLGLGPFIVNMAAIYQINFVFMVVFARAPLIISDLVVVIVTWIASYKVVRLAKNTIQGPTLHQVMLENGTLYFLCLMVLNILQIVFYVLSIFAFYSESYISETLDP